MTASIALKNDNASRGDSRLALFRLQSQGMSWTCTLHSLDTIRFRDEYRTLALPRAICAGTTGRIQSPFTLDSEMKKDVSIAALRRTAAVNSLAGTSASPHPTGH